MNERAMPLLDYHQVCRKRHHYLLGDHLGNEDTQYRDGCDGPDEAREKWRSGSLKDQADDQTSAGPCKRERPKLREVARETQCALPVTMAPSMKPVPIRSIVAAQPSDLPAAAASPAHTQRSARTPHGNRARGSSIRPSQGGVCIAHLAWRGTGDRRS
jgi:hypothetical protein